jgi:tetratricopeptide (TPR) repeat protein
MKPASVILIISFLFVSCNKVDLKSSLINAQEHIKSGEFEKADTEISKCLSAAADKPEIYILAAIAKAENGDKEEALKIVNIAEPLFQQQQNAEALAHLGYACLKIEEYDKALEILSKSSNIDPENIYTVTLLINAEYQILKEPRKYAMRNNYMKLAERFPALKNSLEYFNLKAVTKAFTGIDRTYIIQNLSEAYKIDSKNATILLNLAVINDSVFNQKNRAVTYYNKYLERVRLLPKDDTQSEKVKRRLTELQNL